MFIYILMQHLFSNKAFPLVDDKASAIAALRSDITKAAAIRAPEWGDTLNAIKQGIKITTNPALAARFNASKDDPNKKMTGEKEYFEPFTYDDISKEAQKNGIIISDTALNLMTEHLTMLRDEFTSLQIELKGTQDFETTSRLLFAPKGAIGRAPVMHVDDTDFTLHITFDGATLRVHTGMDFGNTIWDMLDRQKTSKTETENNDAQTQALLNETANYHGEFSSTKRGDAVIMNGQKGRNLSDPAERKKVCAHASSQMISVQGQVAATFFTRPAL